MAKKQEKNRHVNKYAAFSKKGKTAKTDK